MNTSAAAAALSRSGSGSLRLGVLALSCSAVLVTAFIGAWGSADAPAVYASLRQPAWAPPAWLFGPAWTLLYALMAIAAWLVVRAAGWMRARWALMVYGLQLVANAAWSWFFFRWELGPAAFGEAVVLAVLVGVTTILFWRLRPLAGALLLPLLAWTTFAAVLSGAMWRLNPGDL